MSSEDDWCQKVRKKLIEIYGADQMNMANLTLLLEYFNNEVDKEKQDNNYESSQIQTLKAALEMNNDAIMKSFSDKILQQITPKSEEPCASRVSQDSSDSQAITCQRCTLVNPMNAKNCHASSFQFIPYSNLENSQHSANNTDDLNQQIRKKMTAIYGSEKGDLQNFIFFLAFFNKEVEKEQQNLGYQSPFIQALKNALDSKNENDFKNTADQMIIDVLKITRQQESYASMQKVYQRRVGGVNEHDSEKRFILVKHDEKENSSMAYLHTVLYGLYAGADDAVMLVSKSASVAVGIGIAAVFLSYECWKNIRQWWKGEISGKRCSKNCVDSLSEAVGGVGGAALGGTIGTLMCPGFGTFVGAITGALICSQTAKFLSDIIARRIFDLPKTQALENAYKVLEIHHTATNAEINTSFRRSALKFHPDKGGRVEDFQLLQFHMAIIKMARGE